jgi:hypothetical protein
MSATTAGALIQYLQTKGLGIPIYRDEAPPTTNGQPTPRPYLTVSEGIATVPDPLEDGASTTAREHVTLDLWMDWKNTATNQVVESFTLPGAVTRALQGTRLLPSGSGAPPTTVYGVITHSVGPRILERNENSVHVPYWIEIYRAL